MLTRLLSRLDAFEDGPLAPVVGLAILSLITFVLLLVPEPSLMVAQ